jgi:hypothetical protein
MLHRERKMRETSKRILNQGLVAGAVGYVTVSLVMAVASVVAGQSPLYFAAMMGASLVYGITDPAAVTVAPEFVLSYNGLHLLAFLALGMLTSWLAAQADRGAQLWYVGLFFFILVSFHLMGAVQLAAEPVRTAIPVYGVWVAGVAAAATMATYILATHPMIRTPQPWDG